jgi:hypothetical protein
MIITTLLQVALLTGWQVQYPYTSFRRYAPPVNSLLETNRVWRITAERGEVTKTDAWCEEKDLEEKITKIKIYSLGLFEHYTAGNQKFTFLSVMPYIREDFNKESYPVWAKGGMLSPPLVPGEEYLVWGSPFNGKNTEGSFRTLGHKVSGYEESYDIPRSIYGNRELMLMQHRMRILIIVELQAYKIFV